MRRLIPTIIAVGALAAGTASATSLGDFGDVTFAATDIELASCTATDVDVLPSAPAAGVTDDTFGVASVRLVGLAGNCDGKLVDISFIGDSLVPGTPAIPGTPPVPGTGAIPTNDNGRHDWVTTRWPGQPPMCVDPAGLPGGSRNGSWSTCDTSKFTLPAASELLPNGSTTYVACHYHLTSGTYPWPLIPGRCASQVPGTGGTAGTPGTPGTPAVPDSTVREVLSVQRALLTGSNSVETLTFSSPLALDIEEILDVEIVVYDAPPAP